MFVSCKINSPLLCILAFVEPSCLNSAVAFLALINVPFPSKDSATTEPKLSKSFSIFNSLRIVMSP